MTKAPARPKRRQLVSLENAAAQLGVSPRTIRRWIGEGLLMGFRLGRRLLRVDQAELDAFPRQIPTAGS